MIDNHQAEAVAIRCQRLCKDFGEVQAVRNLELSVPQGSIFGFLGRNGAGKTTTIRMLTGLASPTSGKAWVAGIETTNGDSPAREMFGYLPQTPGFYGWMTAVDFLEYAGRLFGMPAIRRKRRIEAMLALTGLESAARRCIRGYSGGMRQRLGIAQALIQEPPVLFLDEPTSSLDPAGRHEVLDMIARLQGQVTVFFSSHILDDVERICDTIGIIHKGKLLLVSGRDELLQSHAVDAVELVFEGDPQRVKAFAVELALLPWVERVSEIPSGLRILVSDVPACREELLSLLAARALPLRRYEWVRPGLEEIFLQVSE